MRPLVFTGSSWIQNETGVCSVTLYVLPHVGMVSGRMSRSPIARCQNSRHQTYWRISVGTIKNIFIPLYHGVR